MTISNIKRIMEQNDRMKEWFKKRTNISGFLFEQMTKIDEILSTTIAARDGTCEYKITKDEYELDVILIGCNRVVLWYDRDWKYCPFCGGHIKFIDEVS
jgi:hypothetical protein